MVDYDEIDFFCVVCVVFVHIVGTGIAFRAFLFSEMQRAIVFKGNIQILLG